MVRVVFCLMTLVLLIGTFIAAKAIPDLQVSDDHQLFLKNSSEQYTEYLKFKDSFPQEQQELLVIVQGNFLAPSALRSLYSVTSELHALDEVTSVTSILTVPWVHRKASDILKGDSFAVQQFKEKLSDIEYLPSRMVSDQFDTTVLTVTLTATSVGSKKLLLPAVEEVRRVLTDTLEQQLSWRLAGYPALRVGLVKQIKKDSITFGVLAALLSSIAAFFVLGSFRDVLVSVVGPAIAVIWTMALMTAVDIRINSLNQMVIVLVLVITYSNTIHLIVYLRKRLLTDDNIEHAIRKTYLVVSPACLMTSLTTAIGFASLFLSDSHLVKQFGLLCAMGTVAGFVVIILSTPLMAICLGTTDRDFVLKSDWFKLPATVNCDRAVIMIGCALCGLFLLTAVQLRPDYTVGENLPGDSEFRQASLVADQKLGGILPLHIMIEWEDAVTISVGRRLRDLRKVQRLLDERTEFNWVSVVDLLRFSTGFNSVSRLEVLPDSVVARLFNQEKSTALISTSLQITRAGELNEDFQALDSVLSEIALQVPEVSINLNGFLPLVNDTSQGMIRDLIKSLAATFLLVSALLLLVFRSWRLAVLLFVPNIAPLAAVASVLVWSGMPLQFSSVVVFSICLGIVVDDSIHFIHRYLHHRKVGLANYSAVSRTQDEIGRVLLMTSMILIFGMLSLSFGSNPTVSLFGILLIVALVVAVMFDLILLPALLRRFYKGI